MNVFMLCFAQLLNTYCLNQLPGANLAYVQNLQILSKSAHVIEVYVFLNELISLYDFTKMNHLKRKEK